MADYPREFGIIGCGRMGGNLARQARDKGIKVVGLNADPVEADLLQCGFVQLADYSGFRENLQGPRAILLYIPAGPAIDAVLEKLIEVLEPGDVIVDGGNSYWGDSIRRGRRMAGHGIHFVDMGTSGGVEGARYGACFMVGGERKAVERIEPMLLDLCVPGGYVHAGPSGAGHFSKLVHNGIEFGMLQAIGEGVDLLENFSEQIDVQGTLNCWRFGSVIRSWLVDLMAAAYKTEQGLDNVPAYVEDTGEVNWLVNDALRLEVPTPVITQSVIQLAASRDNQKNWARAIAMMRRGFGGHPYGPHAGVASIRQHSQVGDFPKEALPVIPKVPAEE